MREPSACSWYLNGGRRDMISGLLKAVRIPQLPCYQRRPSSTLSSLTLLRNARRASLQERRTLHIQEMEGSDCSPVSNSEPLTQEMGPWVYTHLLEEMGRPSFCHPAWNSGGMLPGQKSCTACPGAACTRESSEPAKLILERQTRSNVSAASRLRSMARETLLGICRARVPWETPTFPPSRLTHRHCP